MPHDPREVLRRIIRRDRAVPPGGPKALPDRWAPPTPLPEVKLPPFPVNELPAALAEWVQDTTDVHAVPPDLPGLIGLGVVAGAAARRFEVQVGPNQRQPVNLYAAAVARSGERKSAAMRSMLEPLREAESELIAVAEPRLRVERARAERAAIKLRQLNKSAAREDGEAARRIEAEADALAAKSSRVPARPKLLAGNVTPEQLEVLLDEQGGALTLESEEADSVFAIAAGRYAKDGGAQLDTLLKGYDGAPIDTARIGREAVRVDRPALTIILTPQPSVLEAFSAHPEFKSRGLVGRFVYAVPATWVGTRMYNNRAPDESKRQAYGQAIRRILSFPAAATPGGRHVLELQGEALVAYQQFHDAIELQQAEGHRLEGISDWASKHAMRVARMAAGFHLLETDDENPWERPISASCVERACIVGWYLVEHALAAYQLIGAETRPAAARRMLRWIERSGCATFTRRELYIGLRGVFPRPDELEPGLGELEEHGYIRRMPPERKDGPGRPRSPQFEVNPHVHNAQNAQNGGRGSDSAYFEHSAGTVRAGGESAGDEIGPDGSDDDTGGSLERRQGPYDGPEDFDSAH